MRWLRVPLLGAALLCAMNAHALAEKRAALVIGNSAYRDAPQLSNPVHDAGAIAALFKSAGFETVELHRDLAGNDLRLVIRHFIDAVQDADIAVVFYAGHGIEVNGANYLVPVDAKLERDIDVEDEAVSLDRVLQVIEPAKRLRLVILDACRDNPLLKTMKRTVASRSIGRGLAEVAPATSDTLIAFAARAGSTAVDGEGRNSPFTAALLKNLATPGLDVRLALGRVRDEVLKATHRKQEPFVYGSLGGETVALVPAQQPKRADAAPALEANDADPDARRHYEFAERIGTRQTWDSFLATHGTGFFADLARAQREKLARIEDEPGKKIEPPGPAVAERHSEPTPGPVAALSPNPVPAADFAEIARLLQGELNRVGCGSGDPDGHWGSSSRHALEAFNADAGTTFEVKMATLGALDAVRARDARVCPLVCRHGFRPAGDRCVETVCKGGYVLGDDGECERKKEPREAREPKHRKEAHEPKQRRERERREASHEHEEPRSVERHRAVRERRGSERHATGSGGSDKILCTDKTGCQTYRSTCHVEYISGTRSSFDSVVCR